VTKRAVLLIAIVGVLCFGLLGNAKPVNAVSSKTRLNQNPFKPVKMEPQMIGSPTAQALDATVDPQYDSDTAGFGITTFNNIQIAVNSVGAGAAIIVNTGNYIYPTGLRINKPLTILGKDIGNGVPLINGKITLVSQGDATGLIKLYNLRFGETDGAIIIGGASGAVFGEVELRQLTFGTTSVSNSKAIQTASSVQIKKLSVLGCVIKAAHGIELNGDIGSAVISNNTFDLMGQSAGHFDAITINQDTKAVDSVNAAGTLIIQGNTLNIPTGETYPYASAILNQATFTMTSLADGKKLTAGGNTLVAGGTTITDQKQFIQDKIADFVPVNVAPVAVEQTVATAEDTAANITLSATDVDGDSLTYAVVGNPTHGTLSGTTPNLTYTPAVDYNGSDSFTYKANDGTANSNVATVTITITVVNDVPVVQEQTVTTAEDTTAAITLSATDVDGDSLTYAVVGNPTHGTLSGTTPNLTYTPAVDYNGSDSFTFKAIDGEAESSVAAVSITMTAVNDAPVANAQTVTTPEDTAIDISLTGTDSDGDSLIFTILDNPTHGTLSGTALALTYTPALDYAGPDSFTFKANDGTVQSNTGTINITITAGVPTQPLIKLYLPLISR
jgi:hypothetical protein